MLYNGQGEIRTHGTLAGTPVFETGAFNHSATYPTTPCRKTTPTQPSSIAERPDGVNTGPASFLWPPPAVPRVGRGHGSAREPADRAPLTPPYRRAAKNARNSPADSASNTPPRTSGA